jgi:hypothetical protein
VLGLSRTTGQVKEINGIHIKEGIKLFLLANDMILYTAKPEDTNKNLFERIKKFSKVAGYKF